MTDETTPETAVGSDETQAATPRRSKSTLFIVAGLGVGAAVGMLVVGPSIAKRTVLTASVPATPVAHETAAGEHGAEASPHLLENLVVNPSDSRGTRFLLVSVGIQMSDAAAEADIKTRETQVRDHVLQVLGAKSIDELVDIKRRDSMRREIAVSLDSLLGTGKVRAVFFPQFVIQ